MSTRVTPADQELARIRVRLGERFGKDVDPRVREIAEAELVEDEAEPPPLGEDSFIDLKTGQPITYSAVRKAYAQAWAQVPPEELVQRFHAAAFRLEEVFRARGGTRRFSDDDLIDELSKLSTGEQRRTDQPQTERSDPDR